MSYWLPRLPQEDVSAALDRCTVVLPRPGDGWYAAPGGSSGPDGFPWGDLTAKGATAMHSAGQGLVHSEQRPRGAARAFKDDTILRPARRSLKDVTVRSLNLQRNIMSAQGLVAGAQQALQDGSSQRQWPVEVLLQQSEDLVAQVSPATADYPGLVGERGVQLKEMMQPMTVQLLEVARSLGSHGAELASLATEDNFEQACDVLACLEAEGLVEPLGRAMTEKVSALSRFRFLRWVAPIHAGGSEAAKLVVGPLLQELFRACDRAGESPAEPDRPVPLVIYVSHAEAIATTLASLGMVGADRTSARWEKLTWPSFGSSLEIALVTDEAGELFLQLIHDGEVYVPGLGRDIIPYALVKERFPALND